VDGKGDIAMIIFTATLQDELFCENEDSFKRHGVLPRCRNCPRRCRQANVPGLLRLVCPMSLEWEAENERLNNGGIR